MALTNLIIRDKFDKVYISPDLTRMQQEEDRKLRDMVKEYRKQGMVVPSKNRKWRGDKSGWC